MVWVFFLGITSPGICFTMTVDEVFQAYVVVKNLSVASVNSVHILFHIAAIVIPLHSVSFDLGSWLRYILSFKP